MTKHRAYTVTINNPTEQDCIDVLSLQEEVSYMIFADEIGEQGTPHLQGYIHFTNARHLKSVSKMIPRAHLETAKGTPDQNFEYCTKDGYYYEYGNKPSPGRACWDKVEAAMEDPKNNFQVYHQYRRAYQEFTNSAIKEHQRILKLINLNDYRKYMYSYQPSEVCSLYSEYDNERVHITQVPYSIDNKLIDWHNGFPPKVDYGYQKRYYDPEIIYLCYVNEIDKQLAVKHYLDIIDEVL